MDRKWVRTLVAAVVVAVAVAAGTTAWAMNGSDDDDRPATVSDERDEDSPAGDGAAGTCLEGTTDCVDDPSQGSGAAGSACLAGSTDCADDPSQTGGGAMGMCVEGVPDCVDMIVEPGGETACPEGIPDEECAGSWEPVCFTDDGAPAPCVVDSCVQPVDGEPLIEPAPEPVCPDDVPPTDRELPPDCAISSDGTVYCPEEGSSGDGDAGSAPGSPPTDGGVVDPVPAE